MPEKTFEQKINQKYGHYFEGGDAYTFLQEIINSNDLYENKRQRIKQAFHVSIPTTENWMRRSRKLDGISK